MTVAASPRLGLRSEGTEGVQGLRQDIIAHWPDYVAALPPPTVRDLEQVMTAERPGVYRVLRAPTLLEFDALVRGFPGEVGLMKLFGEWYISYNLEEATRWGRRSHQTPLKSFDDLIGWIDGAGVADLDLHSHPQDDESAMIPSLEDVVALRTSRDGVAYIWTSRGMLEFRQPSRLPGGHDRAKDAWSHWVKERFELADQTGEVLRPMSLRQEFFRTIYQLRVLNQAEAVGVFGRADQARGCERWLWSTSITVRTLLANGSAFLVRSLAKIGIRSR